MSRLSEEVIKSQAEYMQLFGAEKESFAAGARWAETFLDAMMKAEIQVTLNNILANSKMSGEIIRKEICKHTRIEEIQGGQIEKCLDCGKTWG